MSSWNNKAVSFCTYQEFALFLIDDVRKIVEQCNVCADVKPRFYKPRVAHVIKATQPLERLSIDFKDPLPTTTKNRYILTVVDEFSRFPFAFPCATTDAISAINCQNRLLTIFGKPDNIHSHRL